MAAHVDYLPDCAMDNRRTMKHCDTLINAGILVTQDDERRILEDSSLAIAGGRILAIGSASDMKGDWTADRVVDLPEAIVMPGLINAHTHAAMTFLRGLADDLPLMTWLTQKIFPVEAHLSAEIVRLGSLLGYAEMLASGTTACIDMYIFEDAVFEAASQAGLRCLGGEAVFAFPSAACKDYEEALAKTHELALKYSGDSRLKIAVNPHSVYTTSAKILADCRKLALDLDLPLHIHLGETQTETGACLKAHCMRPVEYCAANGLFDCQVIGAHLVDIEPDEIAFLARQRFCAVHNPASNMKLASGVSPVPRMLAAGISVALGSDGAASNNTLNMFAEMGRAALLHKLAAKDPTAAPACVVLDMATRGGAIAFGDPGLGALVPGARADCIALDTHKPHMRPLYNPVSQIVYAASGHECVLTMVEGEILYENGRFTRFDYEDVASEAASLSQFAQAHCK